MEFNVRVYSLSQRGLPDGFQVLEPEATHGSLCLKATSIFNNLLPTYHGATIVCDLRLTKMGRMF